MSFYQQLMVDLTAALPDVRHSQALFDLVRGLATYITEVIDSPHTFEQLRRDPTTLKPIVLHLTHECNNTQIISALLILRWHFGGLAADDDLGIQHARAFACEIIAWRFLSNLSGRDTLEYLLSELPDSVDGLSTRHPSIDINSEEAQLLSNGRGPGSSTNDATIGPRGYSNTGDFISTSNTSDITKNFAGRNALEIAVIAEARKFLSQRPVQNIIQEIWRGEIIFYDTIAPGSCKRAQRYNKRKTDLFARLRVPRYHKAFEAVFFALFVLIYYVVLLERNPERVSTSEVFLYIWLASFFYEELGEYRDAGQLLYTSDLWNLTDICIMVIAVAFLIARIIGLTRMDPDITNVAFDILSLEALFLIPRLFALLSVHPYFGVLIPCLKEMTQDFMKFLGIVVILYLGFLTTFSMLARDVFTLKQISWYLIYVFFGSSYMGFDIASQISPVLGPPLMVVFVIVTNVLLVTSLISLLTNTLTRVLDHAREEYLFQYSVFVLEASALRRLTYYSPPLNLLPLVVFRPLRLFLAREDLLKARILLLRITHTPFVAIIWLWETISTKILERTTEHSWSQTKSPSSAQTYFATEIEAARAAISTDGNKNTSFPAQSPVEERSGPSQVASDADLKAMLGQLAAQIQELNRRLDEKEE